MCNRKRKNPPKHKDSPKKRTIDPKKNAQPVAIEGNAQKTLQETQEKMDLNEAETLKRKRDEDEKGLQEGEKPKKVPNPQTTIK